MKMFVLSSFRFCDGLNNEKGTEHDRFLEECISDPSLRDKMAILSRTFQNRKRVGVVITMLTICKPFNCIKWFQISSCKKFWKRGQHENLFNVHMFTTQFSVLRLRNLIKPSLMIKLLNDWSILYEVSVKCNCLENFLYFQLVNEDNMIFADDVFKFEPVEGDIWPNSNAEITVIFKPTEAKSYTCTAFCDITGRESRLPLRMQGVGIGPKVQLSFDRLDMGNIFVSSAHTYEVVLANKGDIDAIFSIMPQNTVFGPKFSFNPSEGIVMPDGHQAIQVTFNSSILGDFEEEFSIQIDGSPETLKLVLT